MDREVVGFVYGRGGGLYIGSWVAYGGVVHGAVAMLDM